MGYPPDDNSNTGYSALFTQSANGVFNNTSQQYGFNCDSTVRFGLLTDLTGNGTLDLVCGGLNFPTKIYQINQVPFLNKTSVANLKTNTTVDAVSADFDGDEDNDLFMVRRKMLTANAYIEGNNTVNGVVVVNPGEKGLNIKTTGNLTLTFSTGLRKQYVYFGSNKTNLNLNQTYSDISNVFSVTLNANNQNLHGLGAYDTSNGISNAETGIYIGYFPAQDEWRLRLVANIWSRFMFKAVSTDTVTEIEHVGYNPQNAGLVQRYLMNRGVGNGFIDKTDAAGLSAPMTVKSVVSADFDNDMDIDLFLICEHEPQRCDHYLFENDGTGKFTSSRIPSSSNGIPETAVIADYNVDGCVDIATANGYFAAPFGASDHLLYQNDCDNGNTAIEIDLVGTQSNRDGTGAKVKVSAGGTTQVREQGNNIHRFAQNDKRLHFGMGAFVKADIEISWPSGQVDEYENVDSGFLFRAIEGDSLEVVQSLSGAVVSPRLSVANATVDESLNSVDVDIALNPANPTDIVSLNYTTQNQSATAPEDYSAVSGSLTFQPDQSQITLTVPINDDSDEEGTETFLLTISNATNAVIDDANGLISIVDNDTVPNGQECGEPDYKLSTDKGLYIWKDCNGSETWHIRALAGGSTSILNHSGNISSSQGFNTLTPFKLESYDVLDTSNPNVVNYIFKVSKGAQDGIDFTFPATANTCFSAISPPPGVQVMLGESKVVMNSPFNLQTQSACL